MMFRSSKCGSMLPLLSVLLLTTSSLGLQEVAPAATSPSEESSIVHVQTPTTSDNEVDSAEYEFLKHLRDYNVGKRAYSYVSEYKRLPVYNFGLGKRAEPNRMYSFGLGKRPEPSRMYSFGLGKRGEPNRMYSFGLGKRDYEDDYSDEMEGGDMNEDELGDEMEKRNRMYSFGLGKREPMQRLYSFGLGKRASPSMYSFGLGKRPDARLYSFGLGKRPSSNRNTRFNFGLGKRSVDSDYDLELEEEKRFGGPDQRFGFGLGKREVSSSDLEAVVKEANQKNNSDHHSKDHVIAKRSLHYGFGLGKRTPFDMQEMKDQYEDTEDLSRYARRPYSFGLGKRIPMYDFGVGKRAEG